MQSVLHPIIGPAGPEQADLKGRIAVVTGGALGIGYEISRAFAMMGARVIMINRKEEQGDDAIGKIRAEAKDKGVDDVQIEWRGCDLGNLRQVQQVFGGLGKELNRLDLLILSAGINTNQFGLDADGIDRHFGVNALGDFFAINLLWPLLRKTSQMPGVPPPRVVFESSEMHRFAPSNAHFGSLEEINDETIDPTQLYGRTKLAMILYTKALLNKVIRPNGDNIIVTAVHPGAVNTAMQQQWRSAYPGLLGNAISIVTQFFGRDVEQGSYSGLYAALSPEVIEKQYNGFYFTDPGQLGKESSQASDKWLISACWELSERIVQQKLGEEALIDWHATA